MYGLYVTHPQVAVDPDVPTPRWGLNALGLQRAQQFAEHPLVVPVRRIVSSHETKAVDLANALAAQGANVDQSADFGEARRSGFMDREVFEAALDAFYAAPALAVGGWETALNAQARIYAAVETALARQDPAEPIIFTGHGTVGTLLKCRLGGRTIARSEDQRRMADPGGGNVFVFRLSDRQLLTDWLAMEELPVALS